MDPVSIVLTVLPFLGGAVKAYSSVRKKFRVAVDDETTIQQMLGNPQDTNWSSPELDLSLKDLLADSYEAYLKLVQEVSDTNEELEIELSEYERLSSARQKGESFKDTEKRLRNRVSIAWTKADFEKTIGSLRDLNTDLCRLRQQVFELQKPHNANLISFPSRRANAILTPGYDGLKAIRTASEGLHNALAHSWSRNAISTPAIEARHDVKLFADVKVGDGVRMNLAILCHDHHFTLRRLIEEPAWVVLQVRSKSLDKPETDISTPPDSDDDRSKKRRVRFANESSTTRNTLDQAKPRALPTRGRFAGEAAE
ncbi:hypothetical protein PGQ11_012583 [Apiospora arundinis]|uniref:Fungal N-terminal domain-containing protein n=1 Tax=Apiospora arundinis TaxID=335852 RepID=A0ABR2I2W4_9PEZI